MATEPSWEIFGAELMEPQEPLRGHLSFSKSEGWFVFDAARERQLLARSSEGMSSILIGTLEIHVGWPSGQLLYPIGYFAPLDAWRHDTVSVPDAEERGVRFKARGLWDNIGVSYRYVESGAWEKRFDPATRWMSLSEPGVRIERAAVFADRCVAGLAHHRLVALWLQPEFID